MLFAMFPTTERSEKKLLNEYVEPKWNDKTRSFANKKTTFNFSLTLKFYNAVSGVRPQCFIAVSLACVPVNNGIHQLNILLVVSTFQYLPAPKKEASCRCLCRTKLHVIAW
jgi:hypothetical protein